MIRQLFLSAALLFALSGCGLSAFHTPAPWEPDPLRSVSLSDKAPVEQEWIPQTVERLPDPPLVVNAEVKKAISTLLRGDAACIKTSLERREPHYETIAKIFDDEGIPRDLLNLAVIESRFRADATSPTGAAGIWQFTRSTARVYGLEVGMWRDERRDVIRSTLAAARHLRDLYRQFEDWYLALAAYNAGPGAVNRAVRKATSDNFWELSRKRVLSAQTREFVPRFIAATILVRTADLYGVEGLPERISTKLASLEKAEGAKSRMHAEFPRERLVSTTPRG